MASSVVPLIKPSAPRGTTRRQLRRRRHRPPPLVALLARRSLTNGRVPLVHGMSGLVHALADLSAVLLTAQLTASALNDSGLLVLPITVLTMSVPMVLSDVQPIVVSAVK